jgi:hypothetical protein
MSGPNVNFMLMHFGTGEPHPTFSVFEAGAWEQLTLKPTKKAQPKKFLLQISWTDTSGERHSEPYQIPWR